MMAQRRKVVNVCWFICEKSDDFMSIYIECNLLTHGINILAYILYLNPMCSFETALFGQIARWLINEHNCTIAAIEQYSERPACAQMGCTCSTRLWRVLITHNNKRAVILSNAKHSIEGRRTWLARAVQMYVCVPRRMWSFATALCTLARVPCVCVVVLLNRQRVSDCTHAQHIHAVVDIMRDRVRTHVFATGGPGPGFAIAHRAQSTITLLHSRTRWDA